MNYIYLLFFLCFLFPSTGVSQNEIYQGIKKLPISDSMKFAKIDSLLQKNSLDGNCKDLEIVAGKYSNWLYGKKQYGKAAIAQKIAIDNNSRGLVKLQKRYFTAGQLTFMDFNYQQSIVYLKHAIDLNDQNEIAGRAYLELGRNYYYIGDYYLSIQYFEVAEKLLWELESYEELTRGYINSVNPYKELKTKASLTTLYRNLSIGDSIIHANNLDLNKKYNIKRALGKYYAIDKKKVDTVRGVEAFEASFAYAKQMQDSLKMAEILNDLGILFGEVNYNKSDAYLNNAMVYCPTDDTAELAIIYANLGKNSAKRGKFDSANTQLLQAIHFILGQNIDFHTLSDKAKNTLLDDHSRDFNFWKIMAYIAESYLLQFEKEGNLDALTNAIFFFKFTDDIFDIYTQSVNEFNSKLKWRKDATQHYGRAMKACFYANDTENALYFMEKNKAIVLTEAIDKQRTNRSFNLPKNVYTEEIKLKNSITQLEKALTKNPANASLSKDILTKKERLNSYWDSISSLYPTYIPLQNFKMLSQNEIQKDLSTDEVIIEFHLTEDDEEGVYSNSNNGYILVLEKEAAFLEEIPNIQELKEDVILLTEGLKKPFTTKESPLAFNQLSHQVYLKLFPTEAIRKSIQHKKVTIVPDHYLSLLPFGALTTNPDELRYLLQDSELRYLYSRSFLENNKIASNKEFEFLGMAPVNFKDSQLAPLSKSESELNVIHEFYSGDVLLKDAATKSAFLERLGDYKIIHLATHADAQNTNSPWIAFYDGKITLEELYQTQNNASLVVLSGCNTTLGKQEVGEGVMSLARGFFYSGAQSVMSTLWSIDDKSTATITQSFYKNLEEGQTKSEALRNAKLSFLETNSHSEASPYYWASFIMIGDNAPIPVASHWWKYLLFGGLGLVFLLSGYRFLRK